MRWRGLDLGSATWVVPASPRLPQGEQVPLSSAALVGPGAGPTDGGAASRSGGPQHSGEGDRRGGVRAATEGPRSDVLEHRRTGGVFGRASSLGGFRRDGAATSLGEARPFAAERERLR